MANQYFHKVVKKLRSLGVGALYGHFCKVHRILAATERLLMVIATRSILG